jgi:hypothetical protein
MHLHLVSENSKLLTLLNASHSRKYPNERTVKLAGGGFNVIVTYSAPNIWWLSVDYKGQGPASPSQLRKLISQMLNDGQLDNPLWQWVSISPNCIQACSVANPSQVDHCEYSPQELAAHSIQRTLPDFLSRPTMTTQKGRVSW